MNRIQSTLMLSILVSLGLAGCDSENPGTLSVIVEAEDVILDGLAPGDDIENIADGWSVRFDRYVTVLGDVEVELATDVSVHERTAEAYAIDLASISAAGEPLWELAGLEAGRYGVSYSVLTAHDAVRHDSVTPDDFQRMQGEDLSYLVVGELARADGVSCPPAALAAVPEGTTPSQTRPNGEECYANPTIGFEFGIAAATSFGPCEADGIPGVAIPAGGTQAVALTIHGDHIFFNGFPEGGEGGTLRLAQWLADCDLDLDGIVTRAELERIAPSDLSEIDDRFQLGGSPLTPLDTMWTYVTAQLKTQGHFQGEGECPVDGMAHEHGDEDHDDHDDHDEDHEDE